MGTKVDRATGKLLYDQHGAIPSTDKMQLDGNGGLALRSLDRETEKSGSLTRKGAIRRVLKHQDSYIAAYTHVVPMKATRALPVLVLGPPSAIDALLNCVPEVASDWASVISDTHSMSSSQLFAPNGNKHNIVKWEGRPKDHNSNPYKSIFITITLSSQETLQTLREILKQKDFELDVKQESEKLREPLEFVQRAGFHMESLVITEGGYTRSSFWEDMKQKVKKVQQQIFWLEPFGKYMPFP
ncbi:uncharacterized protein LOC112558056 [Pomacea canaliculata]|nr:uncharacterized protein LOC112558056 [Pomacea canaliculata]